MSDIRIASTMDEAAEEEITQRLVAYNLAHMPSAAAAPHEEPRPLHLVAYDASGALIGGVVGRTHTIPFWLEISILWVDEAQRGHGLGRRLVEQAEQEAVQRGCRYARLATGDYQAPEFYPKLGYIRYGLLADCPPGETVSYFWKPLPAAR